MLTKSWFKSKKTLLIIFLSLVLVASLMLANYLSLRIIKVQAKSEGVTNNEVKLYMLSLSKSKVLNEAKSIAPDYQELGAGGYIFKRGDYFHVVSSAYRNKNDAELVKNSIKINLDIDSEIFTLKMPAYKLNGSFNVEEKKIITKALQVAATLYDSAYDIAVSLDTGVCNETSAKLSINTLANDIATTYANFNTLYPSDVKSPTQQISQFVKEIVKIGQLLASDERHSTAQTYSSHLKYSYLMAIDTYINFVNNK